MGVYLFQRNDNNDTIVAVREGPNATTVGNVMLQVKNWKQPVVGKSVNHVSKQKSVG
jgi:hypothetical protein